MAAETDATPLRVFRMSWLVVFLLISPAAIGSDMQRAQAEARGRSLYLTGLHADGRPLAGKNEGTGLPLPQAFVACVNCHGYEARGKSEAGTVTSDIRWNRLTKPYGLTRPDGRRRAPYDAASFFAALVEGRDPSGQPLDTAMPRFALSAGDAADLRAYLQHLDSPGDQGISDDTIRIGVIAAHGSASIGSDRKLLDCWFDDINRRGGIFRRRVELADVAAESMHGMPPLLALLAMNLDDSRAPAVDAPPGIPLLSAVADASGEADRYRFALYPGSDGRARALARYAITRDPSSQPQLALLYSESATSPAQLATVNAALKPLAAVKSIPITSARSDDVVNALRTEGIDHVVMLDSDAASEALIASALRHEWDPLFLWVQQPTNGAVGVRAVTVTPARITDVTAEAGASYARCVNLATTLEHDRARQLALLASARLLVTALEKGGRDIGRERLVETLQSLREFRSGFAPPGSLTPQRRNAASGVYVVPLPASRFQPEPVWVMLD